MIEINEQTTMKVKYPNIKQTVTSVAEALSQWWQSIPDDVKEELKRYGEVE